MTPSGAIGTELDRKYKSQTLWTKKRVAHHRHQAIVLRWVDLAQ
jgi:hypothetical protein